MFHWFSCFIGFLVHCPHSFLLQRIWLVLVVVVVVVVVGGGGGGCCCFGTFMYFLWAGG